jgi:hypothetical protein
MSTPEDEMPTGEYLGSRAKELWFNLKLTVPSIVPARIEPNSPTVIREARDESALTKYAASPPVDPVSAFVPITRAPSRRVSEKEYLADPTKFAGSKPTLRAFVDPLAVSILNLIDNSSPAPSSIGYSKDCAAA